MDKKKLRRRKKTGSPALPDSLPPARDLNERAAKQTPTKSDNSDNYVEYKSLAPCSIDLSRDAKGQAKWAIKLYGERDEMWTLIAEVLELDRQLREKTRPGE